MLIDDVTILAAGGRGGRGAVAFNKTLMNLGPTGASGGAGGNIYAEGAADLSALRQFRFKKEFLAENGQNGKTQFNDGRAGQDIILKVPVGTIIHNLDKKTDAEIIKIGERILLAKGGRGGKGNFLFRSPKNTSPQEYQEGTDGEKFNLRLELKLIADIGFIGLPNVGKSSLLNELTAAKSKVANYSFTTLEPNLGTYFELILADIPGLIEGASEGKGLGIKFLRHIERTKILFHLISAESSDPAKDYQIVRRELADYNAALTEKPEYLFLTKTDLAAPAEIKKKMAALKKIDPKVALLSIHDWESMEKVKKILNKIKDEKLS